MFVMRGASVIDTDQIAHALTTVDGAAMSAIRDQFGHDFIDVAGSMNREKMRAHVFGSPAARRRLESILHPLIFEQAARMAEQALGVYIIFVVPLLVESGTWKKQLSRVLVIDCPEVLQIARVMKRSAMTEQEVRTIMATQVSREIRLAAADDVIINDKNLAALEEKIEKLHGLYSRLAGS